MKVMQVVAPTMHFHIGYVGLVPVAHGVSRGPSNGSIADLVEDGTNRLGHCGNVVGFRRRSPGVDCVTRLDCSQRRHLDQWVPCELPRSL